MRLRAIKILLLFHNFSLKRPRDQSRLEQVNERLSKLLRLGKLLKSLTDLK